MQNLIFPIFIARLIFHNVLFLTKLFYLKNFHTLVTAFLLIFVFGQVLLLNKTFNSTKRETAVDEVKKPAYQKILRLNDVATIKINNSKENIEEQLLKHEKLLELQPTHRDLLVNAAILNYEIGNEDKFEEYLTKAKQVDPNHGVFGSW